MVCGGAGVVEWWRKNGRAGFVSFPGIDTGGVGTDWCGVVLFCVGGSFIEFI